MTLPDLLEYYLERIRRHQELNAWVEVFEDRARAQAKAMQALWDQGNAGPLCGAFISIKDNLCLAGHQVSAGSGILKGYVSPYTATALERLEAAGAIILGRVNCDEFGMGSSNEHSVYGAVKNPLDLERVPGGSSGGSAAAVAAGTCLASIGSDTGGSIRQPAGFCGVAGFKPSYGRISRWGLLAYASSFDQIGVIAHQVEDIQAFYAVMEGPDGKDETLAHSPPVPDKPVQKRLAILREALHHPGMDPEVRALAEQHLAELRAKGYQVDEVPFELLDQLVATYYVLTTAEASSNLSRYDGVRYGHRSESATDLASLYRKSRTEGFGKEVQRRILLGTFVLSAGYQEAYYQQAQKVRRLIAEATTDILNHYDALILPIAPGVAWKLGEKSGDATAMYLADIFTVHANLCGLPAYCLPIGKHPENGLPVGIQYTGAQWGEAALLDLVSQIAPVMPHE